MFDSAENHTLNPIPCALASNWGQIDGTISITFWVCGFVFVAVKMFTLLRAGYIVAIFMHMKWERLALKFALLLPHIAILIFISLMSIEGDCTYLTRIEFFGESTFVPETVHH